MRLGVLMGVFALAGPNTSASQGSAIVEAGTSRPRVVKSVGAEYTAEARAAEIQGWVGVVAVVRSDGTVGDAKVVESCLGRIGSHREPNSDPFRCVRVSDAQESSDNVAASTPIGGLHQAAEKAAGQWLFMPVIENGTPVSARVRIRIDFDFRAKPLK